MHQVGRPPHTRHFNSFKNVNRNFNNGLKVLSSNVDQFLNEKTEFENMIVEKDYDIIALTEIMEY